MSETLGRALVLLDGMHVIVRDDSRSPWIELDVELETRLSVLHFGIWKATDELYAEERCAYNQLLGPAMGEDPIDVELLADVAKFAKR